MSKQEKSVEERYQKKSQIEHILLRPDSYVGSIENEQKSLWILNKEGTALEEKEIDFVPAFYKIFDEIIVNAADNFQRNQDGAPMDTIKVMIDQQNQMISVWNNGQGIPIQIHKEHNIYIPEMIFGHLLTSSNYDDKEEKVVGGRNGFGAKLTNIFSKKFIVECNDDKRKKYYKQEWRKNMSERTEPLITENKKGGNFTCVTFYPDLSKFKMQNISDDMANLLRKRVYDMAGIFNNKVKVYLNNEQIKIKSFSQYVNLFIPDIEEQYKCYDPTMTSDRWEILVTFSDGQFKQVSFVNGICTSRGGKHVDFVIDKIVERMQEQILKKNKDLDIKPHQIKQNLFIFMNCLIVNPSFDSQTKDTLTTKASAFGSKPELSEKFIKKILGTGIIEQIVSQAKARQNAKLAKTLKGGKKGRITGIPKLDDANDAGTARSENCTLILTEGDSAKALAMAGIEVVGRDNYGVFPLKGKLLNVREANKKQIIENQEIQNICKIIGLDPAVQNYENTKQLRYGSLMIMADQDSDGSHIKGLVINFIHHFWPSLFKMKGFLKEFITPILKVTKGDEVHSFFTIQDFKNFAAQKGDRLKQYKVKYYKGLGTSTDKEAKEYFSNFYKHQINFQYLDENDMEAIELGFSGKKIKERKDWLANYDPNSFVDYNIKQLRYKDFIDRELIHFSNADNLRSIPSLCDGLKPGQRKILFSCFKRNLKSEIKVAQLIGYVAEHSAYHHGEQSLASTIIGMAQNFVGSNNINLMMPIGQFGTRNQGGKEHASARYIFTSLSKITRILFPEHDDHVLKYLEDDNQVVEPEWYMPIIPMCLVNGSSGIGTGWSTDIPNYNHKEIVEQIRGKLEGKPFTELHPWYKGFQGQIEINPKGGYIVKGQYEIDEVEETIKITELPVGKWTRDYKNYLEELLSPPKGEPEIEDIREYHTNNRVHFEVQAIPGRIQQWGDIEKKLKLSTTMQTTNIVMFNDKYKLKRYQSTVEIMEEFYALRLKCYQKRKDYLVSKIQRDVDILQNKMKFITLVVNGTLEIRNARKKGVLNKLKELGLTPMSKITRINSTKIQAFEEKKKESQAEKNEDNEDEEVQQDEEEEEEQVQEGEIPLSEYNYLLSMPIFSLTEEKVLQLKKQVEEKESELLILQKKEIKDMWTEDLDKFIEVIEQVEEKEEKERLTGKGFTQNGKARAKKKNNNKEKEQKKQQNNSSDDESEKKTVVKNKNPQKSDNEKQKPKENNDKQKKIDESFLVKKKMDAEQQKTEEKVQKKEQKKEPMKQLSLIERISQKYSNQAEQQVTADILDTNKRKKDPSSTSTSVYSMDMPQQNLKRKKNNKLKEDDDDFDLDLDFLEPSQIIMNPSQDPNKRTLRSNGKKPRTIYKLDSDSDNDEFNQQNDESDEEEEEEFVMMPSKSNKKKLFDEDEDD
ncbi:DNA topoisomerase IV (macronuclear) [Tetrahymena thermophila SB210]|uniref:DNA topoisomerase 2 n=1 Tax=Tetrahymena thermophila (strain SB210) TaxID=312017 RepID=I7M5X3_TETTS|nr:DNA topoisomerase IV [Tetrahymena thermophila SB210]EAR83749.1 DNA topoisomerase IV [Tetrahymena thermophila SB210]|eukprot:XP_001031412.1 DNA topoisomerase IV [Tetrahymena thermophila SB210]